MRGGRGGFCDFQIFDIAGIVLCQDGVRLLRSGDESFVGREQIVIFGVDELDVVIFAPCSDLFVTLLSIESHIFVLVEVSEWAMLMDLGEDLDGVAVKETESVVGLVSKIFERLAHELH